MPRIIPLAYLLFGTLAFAPAELDAQKVEVRLNGRLLAPGVAAPAVLGKGEVFVSVAGLARAVDGANSNGHSRLRIEGRALYAAAEGGCAECYVQVRRPVLISPRLRVIGAETYLPLPDLVRAFEGKLSVDHRGGIYTIFAGSCNWCVLEPRGE
jgi:hypothetical protein